MNALLILSTADSLELAQRISSELVEAREAACVNIVPGIRSVYRWEGKVQDDAEYLLLIKSHGDHFEAVRSRIRRLHSYQVPEVLAIPIALGDSDYLSWLASACRQ
jgi:periplasmic divalent cation tolerance protein